MRMNTLFKYVCYHPLEHQLLTTGTDRKLGYWETLDGSMVRELDGSMTGSVNALDVSADGLYFVCGGDDKMVKVILNISSVPAAVTITIINGEVGCGREMVEVMLNISSVAAGVREEDAFGPSNNNKWRRWV